jgi:hypothetical protein
MLSAMLDQPALMGSRAPICTASERAAIVIECYRRIGRLTQGRVLTQSEAVVRSGNLRLQIQIYDAGSAVGQSSICRERR